MTSTQNTAWPDGVIARYLTVGGATIDVTEEPGYYGYDGPTQTTATCTGCGERHYVEWRFDIIAHEYGRPQGDDFDEGGRYTTPKVRGWAQSHAEKCRAMPRPDGTR